MSKLFEYIGDISHTKKSSWLDTSDFEKEYVPFVANRAFSYHADSVLAANAMNERPWLPKRLQALFLLHTLRPRKRFSKWLKHSVSADAKLVSEYYGCSLRHAIPLVSLHTPEQLAYMRTRVFKGGNL